MKAVTAFLGLLLAFSVAGDARAQLSLPRIFSSGAVLQRDHVLPVWGRAAAGADVTVTLNGSAQSAQADAAGRWRIELPAMAAGGPFEMTVASGAQQIRLTSVYVGDVWLASGQSNIEFTLSQALGGAAAVAAANDQTIREFKVQKGLANEPSDELPAGSTWAPATPQNAGSFSAVAYFFARDLRRTMGVPIGILNVTYGGSRIEAWMTDELLGFDEGDVRLANGEAERQPTVAYNKMVHPIVGFPVKGFLWYQGESNADTMEDAVAYGRLFQTFIQGWRALWGQGDVPFLWVQLPNYGTPQTPATNAQPPTWDAWPQLRAGQSAALALPNTGEVVTIDVGGEDIHPANKEPVGRRLARLARRLVYGEALVASGPRYTRNRLRADGSVAVAFDHVGGGLRAGADGSVHGFTLAGSDGRFVWADAAVEGDSVVVSSPAVPRPATVRYAWAYNPADADLFNAEDLPAAPFEARVNPGFSIYAFRAARTAIEQGQSTVLSWDVFNASSVTLDGTAVAAAGWQTVTPSETTTYTLHAVSADDPSQTLTAQVTVEVLDPDAINRVLGRPADASTYETCCGDPLVPGFAADGDPATRWSSAWQTGADGNPRDPQTDDDPDDEWLSVDFGDVVDVERVILSWEAAYGAAYDLQLSYDGYLWRTVHEERAGDGGEDVVVFEAPPSGRFLRLHGRERATPYGYSLWEIAAYGELSAVEPPTVAVGTARGNVVAPGSAVAVTATATVSAGSARQVAFFVDGAALGTDDAAPFQASWTPPGPGTYVLTAIVTDASGIDVQSAPVPVYAVAPGAMTRYEAETAATTGQMTVINHAAASGGKYVEGRDAWTMTLAGVTVPQAGVYLVSVGYQLPFESPKAQYLVVNGDTVETVTFTAPSTTAWLQQGVLVPLRAGANEVALHGFWNWMSFDYLAVSAEPVTVGTEEEALPEGFTLAQNYPNPFNPSTVIGYTLPDAGHVRLAVYDVTGRLVATLVDAARPAGVHAVRFDAARLASGLYLYRLEAGGRVQTRRMLLVR